jgi:cell division protein FtsL
MRKTFRRFLLILHPSRLHPSTRMLKLLLCLFASVLLSVLMLQLRQQRLELNHEANKLHNQIESHQAKLWNQQLQIAVYTAPNAISETVGAHDLKLVPQSPTHVGPSNWMNMRPAAPVGAAR